MSPNGHSSSQSNDCRFSYNDIVDLAQKCYPKHDDHPRIFNFKIEPFSKETLGFAGVYDLLTIELYVSNKLETLTFFVKTQSPFANDFQKMIFNEEFVFFSDVMPLLSDCQVSKPWSARCFTARDKILILEDLRAQGYKITKKLSNDQLKSSIASVARFHAASMLLEDKLRQPLDQAYPGHFTEKLFLQDIDTNSQFKLASIEVVESVAKKLNLDGKHTIMAYNWLNDEIRPKRNENNVLCHCDLWCNNLMFDDTGKNCRVVDFQQAVYTSHIVDLVQFIHLNVDRETRKRLEMELLGIYNWELCENLRENDYKGRTIKFEELTRNYEKKRIIGLVTAVQTLPLALLNAELSKEFTKDDEHFKSYMFESRRDFVLNAMDKDVDYRERIEEVVEDLVRYMDNFISVER